jgi:hypothetical protein
MLPTKWNSSTSPISAVTVSGEKTNPPSPAVMAMVFAPTVAARPARKPIDAYIVVFELIGVLWK